MDTEFAARITFLPEFSNIRPTSEFVAEVRYPDISSPPWSVRFRLWSPPNENGFALAWASFLMPNAPAAELSRLSSFMLTLGGRPVATCALEVKPERAAVIERDFLEHPEYPVRAAA